MLATIETDLESSAERVWQALLKRDTFLYVTRGWLGFQGSDQWPAVFQEGLEIEARLVFFNVIPGWRHRLRIVRVDAERLVLASEEGGGFVRRWDHRIRLERETPQRCRYTNEIEIQAGVLTPLV